MTQSIACARALLLSALVCISEPRTVGLVVHKRIFLCAYGWITRDYAEWLTQMRVGMLYRAM